MELTIHELAKKIGVRPEITTLYLHRSEFANIGSKRGKRGVKIYTNITQDTIAKLKSYLKRNRTISKGYNFGLYKEEE